MRIYMCERELCKYKRGEVLNNSIFLLLLLLLLLFLQSSGCKKIREFEILSFSRQGINCDLDFVAAAAAAALWVPQCFISSVKQLEQPARQRIKVSGGEVLLLLLNTNKELTLREEEEDSAPFPLSAIFFFFFLQTSPLRVPISRLFFFLTLNFFFL